MASSATSSSNLYVKNPSLRTRQFPYSFSSLSLSFTSPQRALQFCWCAAKQQRSGPVKKRTSPASAPANKKKKKKGSGNSNGDALRNLTLDDVEVVEDKDGGGGGGSSPNSLVRSSTPYQPLPLPKPPAGFVLDEQGRVLVASRKRIATIVDSTNNFPLECTIRRVFKSSRGDECLLLCPVDMPVQILKNTSDGWSAVSDEEVEDILPSADYALAKIHMHLVYSGFCYTVRGGFCYTEDDILEFRTDDGQDIDGLPTEGIEITCFHVDGSHYMIYTPSDPLFFVSVKDQNGVLQIAADELLDDPAIISAIDEETEFNALVEEEDALLESLMGRV